MYSFWRKKPLVSFGARDGHLDQVIVFACEQISLYHFRQGCQRIAETLEDFVVMPFERDFDNDRVWQAKRTLVQQSRLPRNEARVLQRFHPVPAGCGRQIDRFGELLVTDAPVMT